MHIRVSHILAFVLPLLGAAFAAAQPIDQIPMYGGTDRGAQASLREADEKLISDTSKYYGSRAAASAAFVKNGFAFYGRDDLANAMRRFNQAWLLNPNNPEVYWGFGAVRHDQGRNCESMGFFDRAASFNKYVEGMAPDAARIKTLCALDNKGLSEAERDALLAQADAIYS